MGQARVSVRGTVDGQEWYAYWFNHPNPNKNSITVYTRAFGVRAPKMSGTYVKVRLERVVERGRRPLAIPEDGYVIHFRGELESMADRFWQGNRVKLRREWMPSSWSTMSEVLGAGPQLVHDGKVALNPAEEGFKEAKILTASAQRSALGITRQGRVLLVTVGDATVRELAAMMLELGCKEAMNLDGGASSALYANGLVLTGAGRTLSNVLTFRRYRPPGSGLRQ